MESQATTQEIDCVDSNGLLQQLSQGKLELGERNVLRQHCQVCEECGLAYRQMAEGLARVGRERRVSREVRERALRKHQLRQNVLTAGESPRVSRARLRTLIYPALFALMMLGLSRKLPFSTGPKVEAQGPGVWVRGKAVDADLAAMDLRVRERVYLEAGGSARVRVGETVWNLSGECEVRLEATKPPSMRLFRGQAGVQGAFRCYLPEGVLVGGENAAVQITVAGGKTSLKGKSGDLRWVTASGTSKP